MVVRNLASASIRALEWQSVAGPTADTLNILFVGGMIIAALVAFLLPAFHGTLTIRHAVIAICFVCFLGGMAFLTTTVFPFL